MIDFIRGLFSTYQHCWEAKVKDHIEAISKRVEEHRHEVVVTCAGDCWCWDIDALLTMIEVLKSNASQQVDSADLVNTVQKAQVHVGEQAAIAKLKSFGL